MENIGIELKYILIVVLFFTILTLVYIFLLKYILPRIALLFDRFHDSYGYCIKFIESSEKIKEQLGQFIKIESLPAPNYPMGFVSFAKYRFKIYGSSRDAILNIVMHWGRESDRQGWVFDIAELEVDREIIDLRASRVIA